MQFKRTIQIEHLLLVLATALIIFMVSVSRQGYTSDESWHLNQVGYVVNHGFTLDFLQSYRGSPGPLFVWVHWALLPLTELRLPWVRLVNSMLYILVAAGVWAAARNLGWGSLPSLRAALAVLAFAPLWKAAGLAYTEMSSLLFVVGAIVLITKISKVTPRGEDDAHAMSNKAIGIYAVGAGVLLSLAVAGRQPFLLMPILMILIGFAKIRRRQHWLLAATVSLPLPLGMFWVWSGFQPRPGENTLASITDGVQFVILGAFYGAAMCLLLRPGWLLAFGMGSIRWRLAAWLLSLFAATSIIATAGLPPAGTRMSQLLTALPAAELLLRGIITVVGTAMLLRLAIAAWQHRAMPFTLMCVLMTGGLICSHVALGPVFSNRYMAVAAPFLILAWGPDLRHGRYWAIGYAAAIAWGAVSLWGHLDGRQGPPIWDPNMELFYPHLWEDVPGVFSEYHWEKFDYGNSPFLRDPLVGESVLEPRDH